MSRSRALQYYIAVRLFLAPLMIWTIVTAIFLLLRATPNDPVDAILDNRAPEIAKIGMREQLGLNKSLLFQYLAYLGQLLHLNLGNSIIRQGVTVWQIIQQHFPATVELTFYSMVIALIIGVGLGMLSATHCLFGIITYSLPIFWLGMILQLILSVKFGLFPLGTRFPLSQTPPEAITGLYTLDSLLRGN